MLCTAVRTSFPHLFRFSGRDAVACPAIRFPRPLM
jgi:hypothetical protein